MAMGSAGAVVFAAAFMAAGHFAFGFRKGGEGV